MAVKKSSFYLQKSAISSSSCRHLISLILWVQINPIIRWRNKVYLHVRLIYPSKTGFVLLPACAGECLIAVWIIADTLHSVLSYIPLHRPTTSLICVLIVCDAIMEIWMVCMTPISAAGGPCRPVNQLSDTRSPRFEATKLAVCGLDWLQKKKITFERHAAQHGHIPACSAAEAPSQPSLLRWQWSRSAFLKLNLFALQAIFNRSYQQQPAFRFA